jgi:transcriptional regulator with XRE-family HTH domain
MDYVTAHGLGYEVVAKQIGVSPGSIAQWVRGVAPKASSLAKICAFLKETGETAPTDAAGVEGPAASTDELFSDKQPETEPTIQRS